jgi:hypothetical protein
MLKLCCFLLFEIPPFPLSNKLQGVSEQDIQSFLDEAEIMQNMTSHQVSIIVDLVVNVFDSS